MRPINHLITFLIFTLFADVAKSNVGEVRNGTLKSSATDSVFTLPTTNLSNKYLERPFSRRGDFVIEHTGFALSYNKNTNCPNWVAWELTSEEVWGAAAKRTNDFRGDPLVPPRNRVEGYDYKDSGYDRGHMCPAADMKWSALAMSECFYMSNICPQDPTLNRQWWEHLENASRRWASQEGRVYICCGPIFKDNRKGRSIGNEVQILVPDGFFKVVMSNRQGHEKAIGFLYKNNNTRQTMESAVVTVDSVETLTGYNFFYLLDSKIENEIESTSNLRNWN